MNESNLGFLGKWARALSVCGLLYWGLYALLAPVTTIDSHMYNLARIELADRDGLFGNSLFTSIYHVVFPWTFDAVHLPFLWIGLGCSIPSFCCLTGTCAVAYLTIKDRFGGDAAWVAVLGLLGLTCLVYQGSSTKNDIAVLFAISVWIYARWRWLREKRNHHVFWMILAAGFMAGAKSTGIPLACILGIWTVWETRRDGGLWRRSLCGLAASAVLFGSVETYVESTRIFHHPMGPQNAVQTLGNRDGLRGGVANLSRHLARGVYLGPTNYSYLSPAVVRFSLMERGLLKAMNLQDKGASPQFKDEDLFLFQSGWEEFCGYGPVGTTALGAMLLACVWIRPRMVWWRLAMGGLAILLILSFAVAYTPWANRYLLGVYALGTCAVVCLLWELRFRRIVFLRAGFLVLAGIGAIAAPLLSFNRGPQDLIDSVFDRERVETSACPIMGEARERLRKLKKSMPAGDVFFITCNDSVILPILRDRDINATLVTPGVFLELLEKGVVETGDLVINDYPVKVPRLDVVEEFSVPDAFNKTQVRTQTIYRVGEP